MAPKPARSQSRPHKPAKVPPPPPANGQPIATGGPQFGEPTPTADPTKFSVKHGSDTNAYTILDKEKGKLQPRPFQVVKGTDEPVLQLAAALGPKGGGIVAQIQRAGQVVFHCLG